MNIIHKIFSVFIAITLLFFAACQTSESKHDSNSPHPHARVHHHVDHTHHHHFLDETTLLSETTTQPASTEQISTATSDGEVERLWVGYSKAEIEVKSNQSLLGYGERSQAFRGNEGVHDPLHTRVTIIHDGKIKLVLVAIDIALIRDHVAIDFREKVAEWVETKPEHVIIAATHSHSAPDAIDEKLYNAWLENPRIREYVVGKKEELTAFHKATLKALRTAVMKANMQKSPMQLFTQTAPLGIGYDRRVVKDGKAKLSWDPQVFPHRVPKPAADPTLTMMMFKQDVGPRQIILWNIGVHPVTLGKASNVVSADFPGITNAMIEKDNAETDAMFFMAASAHAQPWIATQDKTSGLLPVSKATAAFINLLTHAPQRVGKTGRPSIQFATERVEFEKRSIEINVIKLGSLTLFTNPIEMFGEEALRIRKAVGGPVMMITMANGWHGYWPTKAAIKEGGYEAKVSEKMLKPGDTEKLTDAMIKLYKKVE